MLTSIFYSRTPFMRLRWRWELFLLFFRPSYWKKLSTILSLGTQTVGMLHDLANVVMIVRFLHVDFAGQLTNQQNTELTEQLENLTALLREYLSPVNEEALSFSVREGIEESLSLLKHHEEVVRCNIHFSSPSDFFIQGPVVSFQAAVMNIVRNSSQALKNHEQPEIVIDISQNGREGIIRIYDNGPGFPEGFRPKLFSSHKKKDGLGIGLWHTVQELNRLFGCQVDFSRASSGGAQTRLCFWLAQ